MTKKKNIYTGNNMAKKMNANVSVEMQEVQVIHGDNVKHYRNAKGYTQEYLAAELGISQPKFSEIERQQVIENAMLEKIAKVLNLGVEWLKDIHLPKGSNNYHQDGNENSNFQNTGDVNISYNYPVEKAVEAYKETIVTLESTIENERKDKQEILNRFVRYVEGEKR